MKKYRFKTVLQFKITDEWYIDVECGVDDKTTDYYLYHKDIGIKMLMFALPKAEGIIDILDDIDAHFNKNKPIYEQRYM